LRKIDSPSRTALIGTALLVSGIAVMFYVTDPHWNLPNVLAGLAALVSIATLFVPPGWGRRILQQYRARK
jgi:hypothetical protein